MQAVELAVVFEIARRVGESLVALKQIAKAALQAGFKHRPMAAHHLALPGIETGEAKSITEATCLRSFGPI